MRNNLPVKQPGHLKTEHGPFDIIGDIHGCVDELRTLLGQLGYDLSSWSHPKGRKVIFLGDLCDRGPQTPAVLQIAIKMVKNGNALCVAGNHDIKLARALQGHKVVIKHGLAESLHQFESESAEFKKEVIDFIEQMTHYSFTLDDGKLVVSHAGLKEAFQGVESNEARVFSLYGETTGEVDEYGLPRRQDWAKEYKGVAMVVYGHVPVLKATWVNNTICVDTGCVFGGSLTALKYPERILVSVPAKEIYMQPVKPL